MVEGEVGDDRRGASEDVASSSSSSSSSSSPSSIEWNSPEQVRAALLTHPLLHHLLSSSSSSPLSMSSLFSELTSSIRAYHLSPASHAHSSLAVDDSTCYLVWSGQVDLVDTAHAPAAPSSSSPSSCSPSPYLATLASFGAGEIVGEHRFLAPHTSPSPSSSSASPSSSSLIPALPWPFNGTSTTSSAPPAPVLGDVDVHECPLHNDATSHSTHHNVSNNITTSEQSAAAAATAPHDPDTLAWTVPATPTRLLTATQPHTIVYAIPAHTLHRLHAASVSPAYVRDHIWLLRTLARNSLFERLSSDEADGGVYARHKLAHRLLRRQYAPHAIICREGDAATEFFIVRDGECQIEAENVQTGEFVPVARLGAGQSFGEISLLHSVPRTATVRCASPNGCTLYALPAADFLQACDHSVGHMRAVFLRHARHRVGDEMMLDKAAFLEMLRAAASAPTVARSSVVEDDVGDVAVESADLSSLSSSSSSSSSLFDVVPSILSSLVQRFASPSELHSANAAAASAVVATAATTTSPTTSASSSSTTSILDEHNGELLFRLADATGDGLLSYAEFLSLHMLLRSPHSVNELAFRLFDRNHDGVIDRNEFVAVCQAVAEDRGVQVDFDYNDLTNEIFHRPDDAAIPADSITYQQFAEAFQNATPAILSAPPDSSSSPLSSAHSTTSTATLTPAPATTTTGASSSVARWLSSLRADLHDVSASYSRSVDHYQHHHNTSIPVSVALGGDSTSLITLPSSVQALDEVDDHLFRFPWKNLLAGGIAGGISRTLVSPLERVKILLQTQHLAPQPRYCGVVSSLRVVYMEDGVRGFFRGNGSNLMRVVPTVGLHFFFYDVFKRSFFGHPGMLAGEEAKTIQLHALERFLAGAMAGTLACVITYPLDVIRTRLTIQSAGNTRYTGMLDVVRQIRVREGWRGLYRGLWPSVVGIAPYLGIDFAVYEQLREHVSVDPLTGRCSSQSMLLCGAIAGTVSQIVIHPLDLVRRRMQAQGFYNTSMAKASASSSAASCSSAASAASALCTPSAQVSGGLSLSMVGAAAASAAAASSTVAVPPTTSTTTARIRVAALAGDRDRGGRSRVFQTLSTIVRSEGPLALWSGLAPSLLKVAPAVSISFLVYEHVRGVLGLEAL